LKKHIHLIVLFFTLISCSHEDKAVKQTIAMSEIVIPPIERGRDDAGFKVMNGVLLLDDQPYSGIVNELYPDKNLKSKSEYDQGKRHGYYFGWYPNGNRWFERFYTSGIKTGTHLGWFENEQQLFQYQFNNSGMYNGAVLDWHKNGVLAKHFNFEEGKEAGSQRMWEVDGKIRANFYTVNGERHGLIGLKNCGSVITTETTMK